MREYFYGKKGVNSYFPFSFEIPFSSVSIYKIGGMDRNRFTIVTQEYTVNLVIYVVKKIMQFYQFVPYLNLC